MHSPRLEIIKAAFLAGFKSSAEGWNGEYPCKDDNWPDTKIMKALERGFLRWWKEYNVIDVI